MCTSRLTQLACVAVIGLGALLGARPAAAFNLDFLNHFNPEYTNCINNVHSQLMPQYRNDQKIHDAIIDACNSRHPAFGRG